MKPDPAAVRSLLEGTEISVSVADESFGVVVDVGPGDLRTVMGSLRAEGYDMLVDAFAVDTGETVEMRYHLRSLPGDTELYVRVEVGYDGSLPSVWESFPAALYPEREAAELFGLTLEGHPNPKRLLTGESAPGWLMRKSFPVREHEEVVRRG
ncbi:MAG: NAD(P)H-quinone oxidoreductase subunit J [Coriobacteriia bacterium]